MVNFLSIFCTELSKILKTIYDLTRKGRQFILREEQQEAFEEIKYRSIMPPVLHMPNVDSIYIQIEVNLQQEVHYIRYRIGNLS